MMGDFHCSILNLVELYQDISITFPVETKMRIKIWVFTFSVFSEAIQWTEHENMYLQHSTSYSFSTLEEAKAKCAELDQCDGITNYKWTGYRLRYGALKPSPQSSWPEYTWTKSFIQWSEHVNYAIYHHTSYGTGRF